MFGANEIVIDIETQKSFEEVGGQNHVAKLGISVLGAYFYKTDSYRAYEEHELARLEEELVRCDRIIGFNIKHFDLPVLSAYIPMERLKLIPQLDLFEEITKQLGHRISLQALSSATLGAKKDGNGLQALQWYKEGKIDLIKKYCLNDVRLTKELYEYGKKNQKVYYTSYFKNDKLAVPATWKDVTPLTRGGAFGGFQGTLL